MFAQLTKKQMKLLLSGAVVMTVAGLFVAPMAFARIMINTITRSPS